MFKFIFWLKASDCPLWHIGTLHSNYLRQINRKYLHGQIQQLVRPCLSTDSCVGMIFEDLDKSSVMAHCWEAVHGS